MSALVAALYIKDRVKGVESTRHPDFFLAAKKAVGVNTPDIAAIKREIGDRGGEANSYNNLGAVYYSLGEYQKAIKFHQQSLAITREIDDRGGEAKSYGNLGNVYDSLGEYQKAIEFHQQSLAIKREIGDRRGEAASYNNLGNVYGSLGEYQKAIELCVHGKYQQVSSKLKYRSAS